MDSPSWLSIPWLEPVLKSNWWPVVPMIGYAIYRGLIYLSRRRIENKPANEKIEHLSKVADLKDRLEKSNTTLDDLHAFRAEAMDGKARNAVDTALRSVEVARVMLSQVTQNSMSQMSDVPSQGTGTSDNILDVALRNANAADLELENLVDIIGRRSEYSERQRLAAAHEAWRTFCALEAEREAEMVTLGPKRTIIAATRRESLTRERIAVLLAEKPISDFLARDLELPLTPENLFLVAEPGVSQKRIEAYFGTPYFVQGECWIYRYRDTQVEISFWNNSTVRSVVIALCEGHVFRGLLPSIGQKIGLGEATIGDILDTGVTLEHQFGARTEEIVATGWNGTSHTWTSVFFGAIKVSCGRLATTHFEWDSESDKLASDPLLTRINWVGGSTGSRPYFGWNIS